MDGKWTYLLVYSPLLGHYKKVRKFLDDCPQILNWFVCLPGGVR